MSTSRSISLLFVLLVLPIVVLSASSGTLARLWTRKSSNDTVSRTTEKAALTTDDDASLLAAGKFPIGNEVLPSAPPKPLPDQTGASQPGDHATAETIASDDTLRGLLRTNGATLVNGTPVASTLAVFSGDLVQTERGSEAKIFGAGFTITVGPNSLVYFGVELRLDHGTVLVETSTGLRVRADCLMVVPVTAKRTTYQVTDVDGSAKVAAITNDVTLHLASKKSRALKKTSHSDSYTIHEGEQQAILAKCVSPRTATAATAGILDSTWAKVAGAGAVGGLLSWVFLNEDSPSSPSRP
jgi:hypothetical protein